MKLTATVLAVLAFVFAGFAVFTNSPNDVAAQVSPDGSSTSIVCVQNCDGQGTKTLDNTAQVDAAQANPNQGQPGSGNLGNAEERQQAEYETTQPDGSSLGLECVGIGCNGGNDMGGNTEGTVLGPRYQGSGMTGVGVTATWTVPVRDGYGLVVEGVFVSINGDQFSNDDGVALLIDQPGEYTLVITDGAFSLPRTDLLQDDLCTRVVTNIHNGNAMSSVYVPESYGSDPCNVAQYIGSSNGQSTTSSSSSSDADQVQSQPTPQTQTTDSTQATGQRQITGQGGDLSFEAGTPVIGTTITLNDGSTFSQCYLENPEQGGSVNTGVLFPNEEEVAAATPCS